MTGRRLALNGPRPWGFGERVYAITTLDGEMIGEVAFRNLNRRLRQAEIGIEVRPPQRGRGYGPEAIRLLLGELFGRHGLDRVYLRVREWNRPARRAYEKVGFRYLRTVRWPLIGVVRYLMMEITRREFEESGPGPS